MDKLFQSVALVQTVDGESRKLLLRWHEDAKRLEFIVAKRLNQESFRESVVREVAWQLNLDRKSGFLVSSMAQLSMEFVEELPDSSKLHVAVAFYNVHVYRKAILESLAKDTNNRWLSAAEICKGSTSDGTPIHPQVVDWINRWSVVQPWQ